MSQPEVDEAELARVVAEVEGRLGVPQRTNGGRHRGTPSPAQVVGTPRRRLLATPASAITPSRPSWMWERWLPAGCLSLLIGRQGTGKTTWITWLVAELTTGRPWPGTTERRAGLRAGLLSLEEPPDRLVARLIAAGADLDQVVILCDVEDHDDEGRPFRRPWSLPGDCGVLEASIIEHDLALVAVDGIGYSIVGDSHNYAVVGSALASLATVSAGTGAAVLGLTHPPKGNADPVTAGIGSTAWTAIPRVTWVLGIDPTDETEARRVVRPAKSAFRLPDHGWSFGLAHHDETEAGYVTSIARSDVATADITIRSEPMNPEDRSELDEAREFVRELMAGGRVLAKEAKRAAREAGISERTLQRARAAEKVRARPTQGGGQWWWFPSDEHVEASASQPDQHPGPADVDLADWGEDF